MRTSLGTATSLLFGCVFVPLGVSGVWAEPSRYTAQTAAEYNNDSHSNRVDISLLRDQKVLWSRPASGILGRFLARPELNLFFFELQGDSEDRIQAYQKNGDRVLDEPVQGVVLSPDRQTLAYLHRARSAAFEAVVYQPGQKTPIVLAVTTPATLKAVASNGSGILLADGRDPKITEFWALNSQGQKLWSEKGDLEFLSLSEDRLSVIFLTRQGTLVEYHDFQTGQIFRRIPTWKYRMLTDQQVLSQ